MIILVKYGEIILKGLNRPLFERKLIENIKSTIGEDVKITREQAVIFVHVDVYDQSEIQQMAIKISKVFGVVNVAVAHTTEKDFDKICETAKTVCENLSGTYKVEAKRSDKQFSYTSPQICREVGGYIDDNNANLQVDVKNPDYTVMVEIRDVGAYVYAEKIAGIGGMPTGTSGQAMLLLSGGIDSPVAGFMLAKRGVKLQAVHFFSYPYTSLQAKEKVIDLAKLLADYCGGLQVHIVPFTEIQLQINQKCPLDQSTVIMRRFMMQIADRIAQKNGADVLITGESVAQVASQTLQALKVTDDASTIPVFRPLIGMDKEEIVQIARKIGTFETSILPYEDCCTVFTPKHPNTKPKFEKILQSQSKLDSEGLISQAIDGVETIVVKRG